MTEVTSSKEAVMLESVSLGSKQFYSAGATFSTLTCAAIVAFSWHALGEVYGPFKSNVCALVLSFVIVLAYALVLPEPPGYPNAGKLRITLAELLFGFINTFIVYSTALALQAL
jgi:pilus assembly protein TadC